MSCLTLKSSGKKYSIFLLPVLGLILTTATFVSSQSSKEEIVMEKHAFDPELDRTRPASDGPDPGTAVRTVRIHTDNVIHPRFGGVGFHAFHHVFPTSREDFDQVIYKRWREMNPSFVRLNHDWNWDQATLDQVASHILQMKKTGTQIYVTTWNPQDTRPGEERKAYARKVVDSLEYLIRQKGATNIQYYCMTNELSLNGWGKLREDMPKFKDYHQALFDEIKARNLNIRLLASDASPIDYWWTIEWATQNMDSITGIYGGHHYVNDFDLEDEGFYPWFFSKLSWGVGLARAKGKDFILGEFGSKQDGRRIEGVLRDVCIYWDTPKEPLVPIQLSEAVIAALNAGVYALGYWTFMDCPDDAFGKNYINKWGTFKCSGPDRSTRALYWAYALLTRYFRGPGTVFQVETNDPRLRIAALQHHGQGSWSIALVNRNRRDVRVSVTFEGKPMKAAFRKYVYDPHNVPQHPFGDLPGPAGKVSMQDGLLTDTVGAGTLTVYTTACDDKPPAPVRGLKVERAPGDKDRLTWQANAEPDICYYRVYRLDNSGAATQLGSTIATQFLTEAGTGEHRYRVLAVDQSGNASTP